VAAQGWGAPSPSPTERGDGGSSRGTCTLASTAAVACAPVSSAFSAWSSASRSCGTSVTNLPSFAKRDLANLPLKLLDAPRPSGSACSARAAAKLSESVRAAAARATDEPAHRDASNRELRPRSVPAGSEGTGGLDSRFVAGGGQDRDGSWAAETAATILMHVSFPVASRESTQTSHSPQRLGRPALEVIRREAAFRQRGPLAGGRPSKDTGILTQTRGYGLNSSRRPKYWIQPT
jgi:hypothetical protein